MPFFAAPPGKALKPDKSLYMMQNGFYFNLKHDGTSLALTRVHPIEIDQEPWPVAGISFVSGQETKQAQDITPRKPWTLPKGPITVRVQGRVLNMHDHTIKLPLEAEKGGRFEVSFQGSFLKGHT